MILEKGQTILNGKYTILKLLGEGGMARVWLARDEAFAGRLVAIKEPKETLSQDERYELGRRFRQEILVAKMLQEAGAQHVVPVYTVEKVDDGHKVLVMKYMAGGDLARRIREHRRGMPIEDVVRIAADICRGLAVAHSDEVDIVHRDIKPSNILFDEQNQAYVADFGLAQLSGMSSRSVGVGQAHPGTPVYMAPEQARSPEPLVPAADVYALGCVLFEMLTGKRYKRVRPGTRVRELRPDVPEWLDEVVWRCVQEDPWDRYEDAGEVLAALEEGEKVGEQMAWWAEMYEAGKAALEAGHWQEAVDALEALVAERADYKDAQALLAQARAGQERERAERARQRQLAELYRKGKAALKAGRWQEAIDTLETLVAERADYKDAQALLARAREEEERERADRAERVRQRRLAELYRKGKTALEAGRWQEAVDALEALVAEEPDYRDATTLLGQARDALQEMKWKQMKTVHILKGHTGDVRSVAFSPDGSLLASGGRDNKIHLWRVVGGTLVRTLGGPTNYGVESVAFSPDGALLASGSGDGMVHLWRVADGTLLRTFKGHVGHVKSVAFSPDGMLLASGARDNKIRLWRVRNGKPVHILEGNTYRGVTSIAFSPDGALLASGSGDGMVHLWRVADGTLVRILRGHTGWVWSVAFSPNGTLLASGSRDKVIYLWRVADGELVRTLERHANWAWSVTFSPSGALLASGTNKTVRLWRVADGQLLHTLEGHTGWVWSVAFSPDGTLLASGAADGTVRLWGVPGE